MRYNFKLSNFLRTLQLLTIAQLSAFVVAPAEPVAAQTVVSVAPFSSVELHDGIRATLRHGPAQSVTLLKGSVEYTRFTVENGRRLVIKKCESPCPRGYRVEIELVTPDIDEIVVEHGGTIQSQGSFPAQPEIRVAVRNGGTIDIRSMVLDRVTASVEQGGGIFTMPQSFLSATIESGGIITYWGDARVEKSVRDGGVVKKGTAAEAEKPLSELSPPLTSPIPPVPPVPPVQTRRSPL